MQNKNNLYLATILLFLVFQVSCNSQIINSAKSNGVYSAVVEIPAGTNKKFEFNYDSKKFECEIINGKERKVDFLPYPGNYGFIINTYMNPDLGGDGDALDVLIIEESITQGREVKIKPLAVLKLLDDGEEDHKIIAISSKNTSNRFINGMPKSARQIIKTWFCNYKGDSIVKFLEWGDREAAISEIEKWKTGL
jgi:inorganic pyrophosphatase